MQKSITLSRLLFKGSKYSASLSSFLSILFCCSGLFLPPLAMVAPQVAGCMRTENTGEPAFYQNQTTVCRSRVPSHHISGSFLCCGFHSTVLSLASSFTQNALPVLWPFLTLWPEWVGSFLHLKFADIPTDGMKTSSVNAICFLISGCCFICFVMRFFFVDVCHPPKPLTGAGKSSLTLWIPVLLQHARFLSHTQKLAQNGFYM